MIIKEILQWLEENRYPFAFQGKEDAEVTGFASLEHCAAGKLAWVKKQENYEKRPADATVSVAVIQEGLTLDIPNRIVAPNSKEVYFAILHHFWGSEKQKGFVGAGSYLSPEAQISKTAYIGHNCTICGPVFIGDDTVIENNVVISGKVKIGARCTIQSCTVIGEDGFGYSKDPDTGKKTMVEHFGGVQIGDDVFIGSHVNIARGTIDDTVISDGVKIAPSTHIGHNNFIGKNATVICSNLFGSAKTGEEAYIVGSTVQNQSSVGSHTVIGMGSVVTKPIPDNVIAFGIPAKVMKENNSGL